MKRLKHLVQVLGFVKTCLGFHVDREQVVLPCRFTVDWAKKLLDGYIPETPITGLQLMIDDDGAAVLHFSLAEAPLPPGQFIENDQVQQLLFLAYDLATEVNEAEDVPASVFIAADNLREAIEKVRSG